MQSFTNGILFLTRTLFDLYIFIMMLRIILNWVHADMRNPLSQFISKTTTPTLKLIRKIVPAVHGIDIGGIIVLLLLEILKFIFLILLSSGGFPSIGGLVVLAFAELLQQLISIFFYSILLFVIFSWITTLINPTLYYFLFQITEPLLRPARRIIPSIAGLDFSPVLVLIFLKFIQMILTQPLLIIGYQMAIGH